MKNDPFAPLSGLDQKLFASQAPAAQVHAEESQEQGVQTNVAPKGRPDGGREGRPLQGTAEGRKERPLPRPLGGPEERPSERRPYDFYSDQVRWLNRMKVEVAEKYRRKITANAMVQLALDLFIADYRSRGRRSALIRTLVLREADRERAGQGEDDGAAERPEGER